MKQGEARRKEKISKAYKKMLEKEDGGLYADKKEAEIKNKEEKQDPKQRAVEEELKLYTPHFRMPATVPSKERTKKHTSLVK